MLLALRVSSKGMHTSCSGIHIIRHLVSIIILPVFIQNARAQAQPLQVEYPNGGETFYIGDTIKVRLSATRDTTAKADICNEYDLGGDGYGSKWCGFFRLGC
jgi:hypothetical protein